MSTVRVIERDEWKNATQYVTDTEFHKNVRVFCEYFYPDEKTKPIVNITGMVYEESKTIRVWPSKFGSSNALEGFISDHEEYYAVIR